MILRTLVLVILALAIVPQTRPTVLGVLRAVAYTSASVLLLIWATSFLPTRRL
jgi:hypothetical protein